MADLFTLELFFELLDENVIDCRYNLVSTSLAGLLGDLEAFKVS